MLDLNKTTLTKQALLAFLKQPVPSDLVTLFDVAYDYDLFTVSSKNENEEQLVMRWRKKYESFKLPSSRACSQKGKAIDPALASAMSKCLNLPIEKVRNSYLIHETFEKAEMKVGDLLEEFVNSVLSGQGWIWCKGGVLRAVDFVKVFGVANKKPCFLQVKNSTNSENSSSNKIRRFLTDKSQKKVPVKAWYRSFANSSNEKGFRKTNWTNLKKWLKRNDPGVNLERLNDDEFLDFIDKTYATNQKLFRETVAVSISK